MKCEQTVLCLSPDIVSCHWFGFTEFYNSSCPVVHSAVSFLDPTTPAPLMDAAVAPVRSPSTRENWCMGTKSWLEKCCNSSAEKIMKDLLRWRICRLFVFNWVAVSSYFVAHRRPIKREGRQPLETLEVSWFYNKNWPCFTTKNILQEDEIYSTAKLKLAGKLSTPSLLLDNCMNLLK